jgi:hypothetical protein
VPADPTGRVVAHGSNPILTETWLPPNLALNGFYHGVEICPRGVGNLQDRTVNFVLHDGDFATSSLERRFSAHRCGKVQVPAVTLDRLCADWPRLRRDRRGRRVAPSARSAAGHQLPPPVATGGLQPAPPQLRWRSRAYQPSDQHGQPAGALDALSAAVAEPPVRCLRRLSTPSDLARL